MAKVPSNADDPVRAAFVAVAAGGALLALAAAVLYGPRTALGVGLGALAGALNLWVLTRTVAAFVSGSRAGSSWTVVALAKLIVVLGGIWFLVRAGAADPIALAVGLASLPIGIVGSQLRASREPAAPVAGAGDQA